MIDQLFHPAVSAWFDKTFTTPSAPQVPAWRAFQSQKHALIAAPTGSGKTLAAFLAAVDDLVKQGETQGLSDETTVLYISPLKALSNDIEKNLQMPLTGINQELQQFGRLDHGIRVTVRTGDTPSHQRTAMTKKPPHILVTTPESLYILLTSEGGRRMLRTTRTVIVDEIHAMVGTKRGTHLALSLERLSALCDKPPVRIGLSATQKPIEEVARFLVGTPNLDEHLQPQCLIVDAGHRRELDIAVEVPQSPLEAVMSLEVWQEVYDRLAGLIESHQTTLVFVNTRRMAERVTKLLSDRVGADSVTSHHGSLSKEHRLRAEQKLKNGELRALVATASLELGIDIGEVDLVCQLGTPNAISTFLQRVGRSGHHAGGIPKGRLFPLTRDELVEAAALLQAVREGRLDTLQVPPGSLDILAQQIVAACASESWLEQDLLRMIRHAYPYKDLSDNKFQSVLKMLSEGYVTRRGRRSTYLHRDQINRRVRGRRGARLAAVTSGGAIPDNADYRVVMEPAGTFVGTVNEDFAIESMAGDIFQLGNTSWRILKVESGQVRVEDAAGLPPTIPFWLGEAPSRTLEFSQAVSSLREEFAEQLDQETDARLWLQERLLLPEPAATQIGDYLAASKAALGALPTQKQVILERFFDESGGMQLVLHAPFGSRINRAWGLALRKRFCRKFNFELQAAATEDAVILSLGITHSFPLEEVFQYLSPNSVEQVLTQALLTAPLFEVRWRWNAGRALAVPRFRGGKKVPSPLLRMQADDLLSVVFPDQVACAENLPGERSIPGHPLVDQTIFDCLHEAMDIEGLKQVLSDIKAGNIATLARDVTEPSPLAQEILNAKPYAFLDDAPLEERRTQAVMSRRWLDPETASDLGALDPDAIERVLVEIYPDARDKDELHDAILLSGWITDSTVQAEEHWPLFLRELAAENRVLPADMPGGERIWLAAERWPEAAAAFPQISESVDPDLPPALRGDVDPSEALLELVRSKMEASGPVTAGELAGPLGVSTTMIEPVLRQLQNEGFVFQGSFTPGSGLDQWCDRRLLARIHRYTMKRLRSEIQPVSAQNFMRFLFVWSGVSAKDKPEGPGGLDLVLKQLEGFSAAAPAWESEILPARTHNFDPEWLEGLCLSGKVIWFRLRPPSNGRTAKPSPIRTAPIAVMTRAGARPWMTKDSPDEGMLSAPAASLLATLRDHGALFLEELTSLSGLLQSQAEDGLRELVSAGWVTSDSIRGLRSLMVPSHRRRRYGRSSLGMSDAGRWSLIRRPRSTDPDSVEHVAWSLLRRYGVVFRRLLEREHTPPWRDLLRVYRKLEARGDIRGGRFVAGFSGEQFALPEAVTSLRRVRKTKNEGTLVTLSAADPLNLVGVVTPGDKIAAHPKNRIVFRDGIAVAWHAAGKNNFNLEDSEAREEAAVLLAQRRVHPALRYLVSR